MTKNKLNAELLVNTASRLGREAYDDVVQSCIDHGINLTKITRLNRPQLLEEVLKKIVARNPKLLIVGSGDGTVSDVVDELANTEIELGIIPLGTTNNFARSLGVPLSIDGAVKHLVHSKPKKVDLGLINDDYFANVAGIGISAEVAATIPNYLKKRYGQVAYVIHGLKLLIRHKPFHARITDKNGKLALSIKTHQLIVANGKYHAGTEIAADTKVDSNELVLFKLGGTSRLSLIWHMLDFYIGRRNTIANTSYLLAKDIIITTNRKVSIELDGEVKEHTPAVVKVKASVLRVRY
jgi:YegS/Rv2252/BmrU family lipid kinase